MKANTYIGQFLETLDITSDNKPVAGIIMSGPGTGKTTTVDKWCELKGYNLTTLIPSNYTQEDLLGIPVRSAENPNEVVRLNPTWYKQMIEKAKNGKKNVLFIDELSASVEFLQAPLFNLIFKHVFDTKTLPQNTIIVSAGNYGEDLNNAFTMTAPMVNRFVILNIKNDDLDVFEAFENDIEDIKTKKEMTEFLGLNKSNFKKYSFDRFWTWAKNNRTEFIQGKPVFTDDFDLGGLLGFITPRSFKYAMLFAQTYMENFNDNVWMRIVGDSLGLSVKREGQPLRLILESNESLFLSNEGTKERTLVVVCEDILNNGLNDSLIRELEAEVNKANTSNVTQLALERFGQVCKKYPTNSALQYLLKRVTDKMSRYY